jgi:chromate reductase
LIDEARSGTPLVDSNPPTVKILGICGSLRKNSYNSAVLDSLARLLPTGAVLERFQGIEQLPLYNEDEDTESPPFVVRDLRAKISTSDALVWVTPEFNHTIPAVIKNAIEWTSHPISRAALLGHTSAVVVVTKGRGGYRGLADLTRVLGDVGGFVVPAPEVCVQFADRTLGFDETGALVYQDAVSERLLQVLLHSLCAAATTRAGAIGTQSWHSVFAAMPIKATEPEETANE